MWKIRKQLGYSVKRAMNMLILYEENRSTEKNQSKQKFAKDMAVKKT